MRITVITAVMLSLFTVSAYAANDKLTSQKDKLSYTIGFDLGSNFNEQKIDVDPAILKQGIEDGLAGAEMMLSQDEMDATLEQFQQELIEKRTQEFTAMAEENLKKSAEFLAENKKQAGWVELPSGLQYKVVADSDGAKPGEDDMVTVEYTGTLIDGTVFDSSEGEPVTFNLGQIIPGWREALSMMPTGATWEVVIPSDLAYGPQGFGVIGPNETLVFEIQLLSVNDGAENQ